MDQCQSCGVGLLTKGEQWYTCANCPFEHFSEFCLDCYDEDSHAQHKDQMSHFTKPLPTQVIL